MSSKKNSYVTTRELAPKKENLLPLVSVPGRHTGCRQWAVLLDVNQHRMSQGYPWSVIKGTKFRYNKCQETDISKSGHQRKITKYKIFYLSWSTDYLQGEKNDGTSIEWLPNVENVQWRLYFGKHCYLFNGFHDHFSVLFIFIFQVVHNSVDDLWCSNFVCQFYCCINKLPKITLTLSNYFCSLALLSSR